MPANAKIIDTTCMALKESYDTSNLLLAEFVSLIFKTGVQAAEVTPLQFIKMKKLLQSSRLVVRVRSRSEYDFCKGLGASRFITTAGQFKREFGSEEYTDLTVELNIHTLFDYRNGLYAYDDRWAARIGGLCVTGLCDILLADYAALFRELRRTFGQGISLNVSDSNSCSAAACFEWLHAGGVAAAASFTGVSGGAPLEELLLALNLLCGWQYDLTELPKLKRLFERLAKTRVSRFKPVAGSDIFTFESGIHADGIFKNPRNYEPYMPEIVGLQRRLVVGKHSGREAVKAKLSGLKIEPDEKVLTGLISAIRSESIRLKRSLRDEEITALYRQIAGRAGVSGNER